MSAEMIFRNALFGGFHKEDVLKYIESMQREFVEQLNAAVREDAQNTAADEHIRSLQEQLGAQEKRFSALAELNDEYCRQIYLLEEQVAGFTGRFETVEEECNRLKKVEAQIGALLVDAVLFSDRVTQKAQQAAQEVTEQTKKTIEETAQDVGHISRDIAEISADFSRDVAKLVERIETLSDSLTSFASKFDRETSNLAETDIPYAHQESFTEFFSQFAMEPPSDGRPEEPLDKETVVIAEESPGIPREEDDKKDFEQTNITPEELDNDLTSAEEPRVVQEPSEDKEESTVIESGFARSLDAFNKRMEIEDPALGDDIIVIVSEAAQEETKDNSELLSDEEPEDDLPEDSATDDDEPFSIADDEDSGEEHDEVAVDEDLALPPAEEIDAEMTMFENESEEEVIATPETAQQEETVDSVSEDETSVDDVYEMSSVEEDNAVEEKEPEEYEMLTHETLEQEEITESETTDDITVEALPAPDSEQGEEADEVSIENLPDESMEPANPSYEEEDSEPYNEAISEQEEESEDSEQEELELPAPTDPHRELTDEEINDLLRLFSDEEYDIDEAFAQPPNVPEPGADASAVTFDNTYPNEDDQ